MVRTIRGFVRTSWHLGQDEISDPYVGEISSSKQLGQMHIIKQEDQCEINKTKKNNNK